MFDKRFRPTLYQRQDGEYNLSLPVTSNWNDAPRKVMVVLETVDSQDLKESTLLFDRSKTVVTNLLNFSCKQTRTATASDGEEQFNRKKTAFCVVNFNNKKFMDKPKETWASYRQTFMARMKKVIKEMKPTHIIVSGDRAAAYFLPDVEYLHKKRGWVFDMAYAGVEVKVSPTLDLQPLYVPKRDDGALGTDEDDDDEEDSDADVFGVANLLFYVSRNISNGLAGRNLYDLSHVKAKPVYIDTIGKFKKFYAKLKEAKHVACDTEGLNLSVNHNAVTVMQFAFDVDKGYVLPFRHEESPFTEEEHLYIRKKMRAWFSARPGKFAVKYIIFQNGKYDLRALRVELGIPVIHHAVWEIRAGEWCLDENLKYLAKPFKTPHGGLEQIFFYYGNDHYKSAKFSKEDRADANKTKLSSPEFVEYCAMDAQSIFGIHLMQIERARHLTVGDKPYLPFFKRLVTKQMSNTVHVISHMKQRGIAIDKDYLAMLKGKKSPLLKLMEEVKVKLNTNDDVIATNKLLLKNATGQASMGGLFGRTMWAFDWGTADHKQTLFFKHMGLKPISFTKGGAAQINKTFVGAYKREYPLIDQYGKFVKLGKLYSAYVKGWHNKLQENIDSREDFRMRPDYEFFDIVTGRLNSSKPSLQQVPTRGSESKYIKRMFTSPEGTLHVRFDYSAHEVRVWSYVSGEKVLADVFRVGQKLRQMLRRTTDPEELKALFASIKKDGDIHIINVKRFLGQIVDKEHPLRDAIKNVVFGVLYGKSAGSLSKDMVANNTNTVNGKIDGLTARIAEYKDEGKLKAKVAALETAVGAEKDKEKRKAIKKELNELQDLKWVKTKIKEIAADVGKLEAEKDAIPKTYTKEFAADVIGKLFKDFKKGAAWLHWTKQHAREHYYTYAPNGMRRNLFSMLTGINSICAAMERRAANSPIQGFASQIGVTTARLVTLEFYDVLVKFGFIDRKKTKLMPAEILKAVHDALYSEVPYKLILIYVHVLQWVATYGVSQYYKDEFDIEFPIEPEIELEFGATEDKAYKWNWTDAHLKECLFNSLKDQKAIGMLKEDPEEVMKVIYSVYDDPELKEYLETKYPILGVLPEETVKPKRKQKESA